MTIGNVIVELRTERNISQQKLANAVGVSQSTIAQIERNRNEATASTIRKLAYYFDVSADYLLGLENDYGARVPADHLVPMGDSTTAKERELLEAFRHLLPETQDFILRSAQSLCDKKSVT